MSEHVHFISESTACRPVAVCSECPPATPGPQLLTGLICQHAGKSLHLDTFAQLPLLVAPGCLLKPQPGDLVSAVLHDQQVYVTAVLQRMDAEAPLVIDGGDVALHLVAPALSFEGVESVEIKTARLSLLTRTSRWVADTLHQVAQSLFVRAGNAQRKVDYVDEVEARHISQHAGQSLALNARMGSINASAVLKIDGGQVHMG